VVENGSQYKVTTGSVMKVLIFVLCVPLNLALVTFLVCKD